MPMHSVPAISTAHQLTEQMRQLNPRALDHFTRANQEAVQTSVWLVSLSSGFLAYLATKPELLTQVQDVKPLIVTLLATVGAGVAQRVSAHLWTNVENQVSSLADIALWAMLQDSMPHPPDLDPEWSKETTLSNLEQYFGWMPIALSPLTETSVTAQTCHAVYREVHARWTTWETARGTRLAEFSRAVQGQAALPPSGSDDLGEDEEENDSPTQIAECGNAEADDEEQGEEADWLHDLRQMGRIARVWRRLSTGLYFLTALLFAASCWYLANSLWSLLP